MRVALLCDSPDERWPSMDLVGEMLHRHLAPPFHSEQVLLPIRAYTPNVSLNRVWFRFVDYPRWLRRNRDRFDVFHIVDHSYSQLAHHLPPGRTVVTCHDVDTFRPVLQPGQHGRGALFRAMTRRILSGLKRAAHVACDSEATAGDLARYGVLPASRLSVVPLGTHPSCSPNADPESDREAASLLGPPNSGLTNILHVGSTIPRKRIDTLLHVFAQARVSAPSLRLVRVGGPFTRAQSNLAEELGLTASITVLPFLERPTLAAIYRRSALVLLPSEAEGFGLPVTEALACGIPVLASDLTVLREVGGSAAQYAPPGDIPAWTSEVLALLAERENHPQRWSERKSRGLSQAARFSWFGYSNTMSNVYNKLLWTRDHT